MKQGDSTFQTIIKIMACIGGVGFLLDILRIFSVEKTYYSCPYCHADIEINDLICKNCKNELIFEL